MYKHSYNILKGGKPAKDAKGALILLHGRGGSASDILSLAPSLDVKEFALYAPQATNNSWYPYSFMADEAQNQPALDSALEVIDKTIAEIMASGIEVKDIYFIGFSQGACLALEYIARNAMPYGGAIAFTGGLVGRELNTANYKGDFLGTPVLITTGVPDPHVPLSRVEESVAVLKSMDAHINFKSFPGRPHTITIQEIELANKLVFGVKQV